MSREEVTPREVEQETVAPEKDEVKQRREAIAKQVQKLLTEQLQLHKIEPERAKTIAYKVVDTLRSADSLNELEQTLPKLAKEFKELHKILFVELQSEKNKLEQTVGTLVSKLIKEGNFEEAISLSNSVVNAHTQTELQTVRTSIEHPETGHEKAVDTTNTEAEPQVVQEIQEATAPLEEAEKTPDTSIATEGEQEPTPKPQKATPVQTEGEQKNTHETRSFGVPQEGSAAPIVHPTQEFPEPTVEAKPEVRPIQEDIQNNLGKVKDGIGDIAEKLKPVMNKAKDKAQEALKGAPDKIRSLTDKGKEVGGKVVDQVKDKIGKK